MKKFRKKGFTLPELMVVCLIIAVILGIATPMWLRAQERSQERACEANLEIILSACKEWALDNPDLAVSAHLITSAEINAYIDGGYASVDCPSNGTYTLPTIDANGNVPNPTCSIAGHAIQ